MTPLYSPNNEGELAVVKSLLDAESISYFVRNEHFGSLNPGPRIPLFNAKTILVEEADLVRARELIANVEHLAAQTPDHRYTTLDRIRMLLEVVFFGWIMPGRSQRRTDG